MSSMTRTTLLVATAMLRYMISMIPWWSSYHHHHHHHHHHPRMTMVVDCFSSPPTTYTHARTHHRDLRPAGPTATATTALHLSSRGGSSNTNGNIGGMGSHYDMEPRGTSYISRTSERDLRERRDVSRFDVPPPSILPRRPPPSAAAAAAAAAAADDDDETRTTSPPMRRDDGSGGGGAVPSSSSAAANVDGGALSATLESMNDLLRTMSTNQSSQATDVRRLYRRMEELASRLDGMENPPTGRDTASSPRRGGGGRRGMTAGLGMTIEDDDRARRRDRLRANKNDNKKQGRKTNTARNRDDFDERYYAVSRVARELGAELDRIDDAVRSMGAASDVGDYDEYDRSASSSSHSSSRVERIEAELERIDDAVRTMEYKLDSQMEVVDMLVDNRGISPTSSFDEDAGLRMRVPLPRPPPQPFVVSPPPIPPPPPPSTRGGYADANFVDDGRAYYQERNYGRGEGISSSQRRMGKSANERSEGHYYDQMNTSFISSFSKMDNERRREFRPFADERLRGNAIGVDDDVRSSSRGIRPSPNRGYSSSSSFLPPPFEETNAIMMPEYYDGMSYFHNEDEPMIIIMDEEVDCYYDDGMYEF